MSLIFFFLGGFLLTPQSTPRVIELVAPEDLPPPRSGAFFSRVFRRFLSWRSFLDLKVVSLVTALLPLGRRSP